MCEPLAASGWIGRVSSDSPRGRPEDLLYVPREGTGPSSWLLSFVFSVNRNDSSELGVCLNILAFLTLESREHRGCLHFLNDIIHVTLNM